MARLQDWKCPRCSHVNSGLLRRCEACRALLTDAVELISCPNCTKQSPKGTASCPECNASLIAPPLPTRPCPNCTKQNPLALSHCTECNYELLPAAPQVPPPPIAEDSAAEEDSAVAETPPPAEPPPAPRPPRWLLAGAATALIGGLGGLSVYLRLRDPLPPPLPPAELQAPYWNSIVGLAAPAAGSRPSRWLATGLFISSDGYLVTSSAAVAEQQTVSLRVLSGSALTTAQRVNLPPELKVAVFHTCVPSVPANFSIRDSLSELTDLSLAYVDARGAQALQPATSTLRSSAGSSAEYPLQITDPASVLGAVALLPQRSAILGIVVRSEPGELQLLPASELLRLITAAREVDNNRCPGE